MTESRRHFAGRVNRALDDAQLQQAISLPNFGSRNGPTELEEGRASQALIDALKARGHEVKVMQQTSGAGEPFDAVLLTSGPQAGLRHR